MTSYDDYHDDPGRTGSVRGQVPAPRPSRPDRVDASGDITASGRASVGRASVGRASAGPVSPAGNRHDSAALSTSGALGRGAVGRASVRPAGPGAPTAPAGPGLPGPGLPPGAPPVS